MNLKYYLGLLFWIPVMVQSQNAPGTVSHERSAKGEVTFYADNTSYSPFTVALTFTRLSGTSSFQEGETYKSTAKHGRTRLIVLRPVSENEGIGFAYRFNTAKGDFRTKTDTNFVYPQKNTLKSCRL